MNNSGATDSDSDSVTASQRSLAARNALHCNIRSLPSGKLQRHHQLQMTTNLTEAHERSHSMNTLSTVNDLPNMLSRQTQTSNDHFPVLNEHRRSTVPMVSNNQVLHLAEQRMAAHAASLQASPIQEQRLSQTVSPCNPLLQKMEQRMAVTQTSLNPTYTHANSLQDALHHASSTQLLEQLKAMMASRMPHRAMAQQMSMSQTNSSEHHIKQILSPTHKYDTSTDRHGLSRCAHSLTELERLRQENQLIQFRQQLVQEKTRRHSSLNNTFESHTTLSGVHSVNSLKRSTSSSSSSTLGKRASDDDAWNGSYGSTSSLSSASRKIHRSTSTEHGLSIGSDRISSSDLLGKRIQKLSLNIQPLISHQSASIANIKRKPPKKSLISILAQQSIMDNAAQAVDITELNSTNKPLNQVKTTIISEVPDRIKYPSFDSETKPIDIVREALSSRGLDPNIKPSKDMGDGFFVKITEMYGNEVVSAIRSNNIQKLRKLHADGTILQCGNQFGETLIHLACRRSHRELVAFLVKEAGVSLRVRDDFGRTPMHDLCWRANPDLELFDILLEWAPELLMLSDDRGHTPLDYSRREHWDVLIPFLLERKSKFQPIR